MIKTKQLILAILLVLSITMLAGCTSASDRVVKTGDSVTVDYTLYLENGSVYDTSNATVAQMAGMNTTGRDYEPLTFVVGDGNYLDAFENGTIGMKVGETKNVTLSPADAYGDYDPTLIQPVNMSILTNASIVPYVNESLYDGYHPYKVRVDSIPNNTTVMVDFNHPLAGKTLIFSITVRDIETVTATAAANAS